MEPPNEIGVRVYTPSPQLHYGQVPPPPPPPPDPTTTSGARRRRAMAHGFQKTLSKTSMLVNFLPTGTLLTHVFDGFSGDRIFRPQGDQYFVSKAYRGNG
ncbi:hypothetical protein E3N88_31479 [Mikania micrantha]|uniref:Uncharacterized protein n=1 Tax=Mikania micrantha TaxID=192012 RepID=A0A5N6MPK1_9ASTR|nr:hypothetical protein E3N88_31479 [Mikania micrantha]